MVVSTQLKKNRQIGSLPQVGAKIENVQFSNRFFYCKQLRCIFEEKTEWVWKHQIPSPGSRSRRLKTILPILALEIIRELPFHRLQQIFRNSLMFDKRLFSKPACAFNSLNTKYVKPNIFTKKGGHQTSFLVRVKYLRANWLSVDTREKYPSNKHFSCIRLNDMFWKQQQ